MGKIQGRYQKIPKLRIRITRQVCGGRASAKLRKAENMLNMLNMLNRLQKHTKPLKNPSKELLNGVGPLCPAISKI